MGSLSVGGPAPWRRTWSIPPPLLRCLCLSARAADAPLRHLGAQRTSGEPKAATVAVRDCGSGTISGEFISTSRGPVNPRRVQVVCRTSLSTLCWLRKRYFFCTIKKIQDGGGTTTTTCTSVLPASLPPIRASGNIAEAPVIEGAAG